MLVSQNFNLNTMFPTLQTRARFIGAFILLSLGAWVLHSYLSYLAWSVVIGICTWPLYQRLLKGNAEQGKLNWAAWLLTLLIAMIILAPLSYGLLRLAQEAQTLSQLLTDVKSINIPPPVWLTSLPVIGLWLQQSWINLLSSSTVHHDILQWLSTSNAGTYSQHIAGHLLHYFFGFFILLVALFSVYQYGNYLAQKTVSSHQHIFGAQSLRYIQHATATLRSTVNGLLLIGLAKGLLLGLAYALVGLSHPAMLGAITGIFAMIPYAAKLIFTSCALVLIVNGEALLGSGLFVYGMILTLIADNYVRPVLIGKAVQLPFIWTLLGIFGGMECLGLLGLFLGPALMAVLISIWRDWVELINKPESDLRSS